MSPPETLRDLLGLITAPEHCYSHSWLQGDLLVFDNAQSIHRREAFQGMRWLKTVKIFAPSDAFAVPHGTVIEELKP